MINKLNNPLNLFGNNLFNDSAMQKYLPKEVYKEFKKCITEGRSIGIKLADDVANGMKKWAIGLGATHYTHWFQPMTGITAEKHDAFISSDHSGGVVLDFKGKELICGEPDASSFPSGGLRATFEARGYTTWDPTSPAFIKDGVLCIPTAFCSYSGDALDKKTPLLRSMEALGRQALRILRLFGNSEVKWVKTTVGAEQEYFLIDRKVYEERKDLILTGRTLFGAKSPKGQELDDHYFGWIKPRVSAFMKELNSELWKLGIMAKTQHNEVAPAQFELAPLYTTTNIAADGNQLTMELMQKIAMKHGFACLLHEKPFDGISGSGKHNNWSLTTDTGVNLFDPGDTPHDNAQFLLFLSAVLKAVDENQDLLRISVATASNDLRLNGNEAPPYVVSVFLGEELTDILTAIVNNTPYGGKQKEVMKIGVDTLPYFTKDSTDRNRTSPFAFTGNKFEFRMVGSLQSISCPNMVLNTAVAEALSAYADELEGVEDFNKALHALIKREFSAHRRIIFNGNGYDDSWIKEAEKRGLLSLKTAPEALALYPSGKNIKLFGKHNVLTATEIKSRTEILLDNYIKIINIEALTMIGMTRKDILPAISSFTKFLSETIISKSPFTTDTMYEQDTLRKLSQIISTVKTITDDLENSVNNDIQSNGFGKKENVLNSVCPIYEIVTKTSSSSTDSRLKNKLKLATYMKDKVIPTMQKLRQLVDEAETLTPASNWVYPSYETILFSVI